MGAIYSIVAVDLRVLGARTGGVFRLFYRLLVSLVVLAVRSGRSKDLGIVVLGHQLAVLQGSYGAGEPDVGLPAHRWGTRPAWPLSPGRACGIS